MLHFEEVAPTSNQTKPIVTVAQPQDLSNSNTTSQIKSDAISTSLNAITLRLALLPTALVHVQDSLGNIHSVRALLDSGSQSTFINESLVQKLNLKRSSTNIRLSGIGDTKADLVKGIVNITIQSRVEANECFNVEALILPKLTSKIPRTEIEAQYIEELSSYDLQFADPTFHTPSKINLLLGADIFFDVLKPDKIKIQNQLIAQSTKLGWVVAGAINEQRTNVNSLSVVLEKQNLSKTLEYFWKIEEVP